MMPHKGGGEVLRRACTLALGDEPLTINLWQEPSCRKLTPRDNSLGVFEEFLSFIFKNPAEKEVFLDWLSWCLQNETDKPSWAIIGNGIHLPFDGI